MTTGIVQDSLFVKHQPGYGHPERPERLVRIEQELEPLRTVLKPIMPRPVTLEELARVHSQRLIDQVTSIRGKTTYIDADTRTSPDTFEAAMLAAGGAVELTRAVVEGTLTNGFALVRPPGHHAESNRAMGFCFFNNVAVAAAYARQVLGIERVIIIDFDVHHGNGTQEIFAADPTVLYFSTHQYPFYPGTGAIDESGRGEGRGFTVNVPLPWGRSDNDLLTIFEAVLTPIWRSFDPGLCIVSAGFDAHRNDPIGGMQVSTEGFVALTDVILGLAQQTCGSRVVMALEGGYDLDALADSVRRICERLLHGDEEPPKHPLQSLASPTDRIIDLCTKHQRQFWGDLF